MTATITTERVEEQQPAAPRVDPRLKHLERRLFEAFDELWDNFVDPAEANYDADGLRWNSLALGGQTFSLSRGGRSSPAPFAGEEQLAEIRAQCRMLAAENEFAINGHENRISYIVGSGHSYRVMAKKGLTPDKKLLREVQSVLDDFVRANRWHARQQEIVRRKDRDGECFLRFFPA